MSKKFWNKLPSNLQANVKQAMKDATAQERIYAEELNTKQFNLIKDYATKTGKLKIHTLNKSQLQAWRDAVSPIYSKFYDKKKIGKDLIQGAQNTK
jgi:C4-dicarboxylate-binding protein DctP